MFDEDFEPVQRISKCLEAFGILLFSRAIDHHQITLHWGIPQLKERTKVSEEPHIILFRPPIAPRKQPFTSDSTFCSPLAECYVALSPR